MEVVLALIIGFIVMIVVGLFIYKFPDQILWGGLIIMLIIATIFFAYFIGGVILYYGFHIDAGVHLKGAP